MGPRHARNSTRARKAHPLKKPRRKPVPAKPPKLRDGLTGGGALRPPILPRIAEQHRSSATEALQELRGVAHEVDLRRIHSKLEGVLSAVIVVQHALMENNCEIDDDAADVLRISSDELDRQIEQIEILLGELPRDERGEDHGGEL
jgi:hypothetical protein